MIFDFTKSVRISACTEARASSSEDINTVNLRGRRMRRRGRRRGEEGEEEGGGGGGGGGDGGGGGWKG